MARQTAAILWTGAMRGEGLWFGRSSNQTPKEASISEGLESTEEPLSKTDELLKADFVADTSKLLEAVELIEDSYTNLPREERDPASRTVVTHILGPGQRPLNRLKPAEQALDAKIKTAFRTLDSLEVPDPSTPASGEKPVG